MKKVQDWPTHLAVFLQQAKRKPFVWGEHDCCLFAADAIQVMTTEDVAADFRGRYKTARGAIGALKRYGGGDIESTLHQRLGEPVTAQNDLLRGDICLVNLDDEILVGVYYHSVWVVSPDGLRQLHANSIVKHWRVG